MEINHLLKIIDNIKCPTDFNMFESNLYDLVEYYRKSEPRKIIFKHGKKEEKSKFSDDELDRILDIISNPDNISKEDKAFLDDIHERDAEPRLNFKVMTIDLEDKSYNKNRDIIDKHINLIVNGANLYNALFDLVDKKIFLELADYCRRRVWLITFKVEDLDECKLVKSALIEARSKRRERMLELLTYKPEMETEEIENIESSGKMKVEYKLSRRIDQTAYEFIDDWLHRNKDHTFYLKDLAVEAHVGEIRYDETEGALYILFFNYFYELHIEEIKLPVKSMEEVNIVVGIIKNLDKYRDKNLYSIQKKKIPDFNDESFDDSSIDTDEYIQEYNYQPFVD